ncbi:TfuA-like protein [Glycomyces sp. NPDC047010]|uniref:TfuA-like protein n=1 Tax=Glycomyces sp. NPDC047010 TaxID=3155023 RepID=UPI0033D77311
MPVHVFCGPTLSSTEVRAIVPAAVLHPPIRHGDALRLDAGPGDRVLIIDGVFHQSASVRHKEILALMATGATVVGCSSMGALRAAELDVYGMIGVGEVYRSYKQGRIDADADVAVTHTQGPEIEQLSVAMVDLESQLREAHRAGAIDDTERAAITAAFREIHYTERSSQHLAVLKAPGIAAFRAWLAKHPDRHGAKQEDALTALRLLADEALESPNPGAWVNQDWRTEHLAEWTDRHTGPLHNSRHISTLAQRQYRQIFDLDYPQWWRARVLAWIAGDPSANEDSAKRAAEASGLHLEDLTAHQRRHWLTEAEDTTLDPKEALLRILVRTTGSNPTWPGRNWPTPEPDPTTLDAVTRAYETNDRAATLGIDINHLNPAAVRHYLHQLWHLDESTPETHTAAARDRGFPNFTTATETTNQFILAELGPTLWTHLHQRQDIGSGC